MKDNLDNWRKDIDTIDDQIIRLLAKRIEIVKKIGKYKLKNNIPPLDTKRFQVVLESVSKKGEHFNLSKEFIKKLYTTIHEYAVTVQKKLQ